MSHTNVLFTLHSKRFDPYTKNELCLEGTVLNIRYRELLKKVAKIESF